MKNIFKISIFITIVGLFAACDMYPDWEDYVDYESTYPVSGEYMVKNYDIDTGDPMEVGGKEYPAYSLYIFNKANNDKTGRDSIWIDNRTGHGPSKYKYKFKIKCEANMDNLTFNCSEQGNVVGIDINPRDSSGLATITNSKVIDQSSDITSAAPDSITFDVVYSYYNKDKDPVTVAFRVAGHRKTGWENPEYDDPM